MIVDNADNSSMFFGTSPAPLNAIEKPESSNLARHLPQSERGMLLVTSRDRNTAFMLVGKEESILSIGAMGLQDTNALLTKKLPNDDSK